MLSVGELIQHLAYVHGLTHDGDPKHSKDQALLGWRRILTIGHTPAGLREVRAVARVVRKGLAPLKNTVLVKYGQPIDDRANA